MKILKFIALVFISIGAFSTVDDSLADNKNPENYKVLSNKNDKFSIINVQNFLVDKSVWRWCGFICDGDAYVIERKARHHHHSQPRRHCCDGL